jgi:hypothetical protein
MAMQIKDIPFGTTDWSSVEATTHVGDTGVATGRTRQLGAQVADGAESHRSHIATGARLFIAD